MLVSVWLSYVLAVDELQRAERIEKEASSSFMNSKVFCEQAHHL